MNPGAILPWSNFHDYVSCVVFRVSKIWNWLRYDSLLPMPWGASITYKYSANLCVVSLESGPLYVMQTMCVLD